MRKLTLAGHPVHPMLIVGPAGLIPFSLVMDLMYAATGKRAYADTAYHSLTAGVVSGLAAGVAGAMDYFTLPSRTRVKQTANLHATMNVAAMALSGINLWLRRGRRIPSTRTTRALSAVTTAGLVVSAWYGAHLVYEHGVRVKGVSPIEYAPEAAPPGDRRIEQALEAPVQALPSA